jgi:hypothetical protein
MIDAVAHPLDTTPERRSPDHLAMTGAPVEQLVAWFERRPIGSANCACFTRPLVGAGSPLLSPLACNGCPFPQCVSTAPRAPVPPPL